MINESVREARERFVVRGVRVRVKVLREGGLKLSNSAMSMLSLIGSVLLHFSTLYDIDLSNTAFFIGSRYERYLAVVIV